MPATDFVLAVDIGGSHITAALIDMTARKLIADSLVRKAVDANAGAYEIISSWGDCLLAAKGTAAISKVCLAMPGPFDYEKGISLMKGQGKFDSLYNKNVKELLAEALGVNADAFFFENDAACFLQGEVFAGCAQGFDKAIGVTLGTGLGTATYDNGRSHSADLWCFPFLDGIAEDYLSTRWFLKSYEETTGEKINGVKELAALAETDAAARQLFSEFGKNLAHFLHSFTEQEVPQAIVIAGNIAKAYHLFGTEVEETISQQHPSVQLKKSLLGEGAALLGSTLR